MKAIKLLSWLVGVVCLLASNSRGASAAPTIEGPTKYGPHELVSLKAVGVDPKAAVLWRVSPARGFQRAATVRELCQGSAAPGTYDVDLLVIAQGPDGLRVDEARVTIQVEGCTPTPPAPVPPAPVPPGRVDAAIGRLSFSGAGCTATPIFPVRQDGRYDILSAAHCVPGMGARGVWTCQDGRAFNVVVVAYNNTADICWLRTVNVPAAPLPMAILARELPEKGEKVWQAGYGVQVPRNREEGEFLAPENSQGKLQFWLSVSSGDSGGPIVHNAKDQVLAPVCCTTRKGARAFVFGGSCRVAWNMREKISETAEEEPWKPVEMPEVEETEEHRAALAGLAVVGLAGLGRRRRDDLGDVADDLGEMPDSDLEAVASGKTGPQRNARDGRRVGEFRLQFIPSPKLGGKLGSG
jgi:MYXO-CTERM domain-containing protein